jgi:hypothetical protein
VQVRHARIKARGTGNEKRGEKFIPPLSVINRKKAVFEENL